MVKTKNISLLLLTERIDNEAFQGLTVLASEDSKALKSLQVSPALHDWQFNPNRMRRCPSMEKYTSYSHMLWVRILVTQALVFPIHNLGGTLTSIRQVYSLFSFSVLAVTPCYFIKISFFWLEISSDTFMLNFFSAMVLCDKYLMCVLTNLLAETFHHSPKVHLKLCFSFFSAEDNKRKGRCGISVDLPFLIPELGQFTERIHPRESSVRTQGKV